MPVGLTVAYVANVIRYFPWTHVACHLVLALTLSACSTAQQKERAAAREVEFASLCAAHPELDLPRGRRAFERQCISCHQSNGQGTPQVIPPLRGHVPDILRAPGGIAYLADVAVHGIAGPITVLGQAYRSRMPAHGPLYSDDDLVAALAYISLMWGNDAARAEAPLVTHGDIQAARQQRKSAKAVRDTRPAALGAPPG